VTTTVADTAVLAPENANALREKVREAGLLDAPPDTGPAMPDAQSYEITVDDGGERHRAVFSDGNVPPGVRALISWIDSVPDHEETVGPPHA
jgi:hypothetical protein